MINKGFISSVDETNNKAVVVPSGAVDSVTPKLVIPWHLRNTLQVNNEVVYCTFDDGSGIILEKMDGTAGDIEVADVVTSDLDSLNEHISDYEEHTHSYERGGEGTGSTGVPE